MKAILKRCIEISTIIGCRRYFRVIWIALKSREREREKNQIRCTMHVFIVYIHNARFAASFALNFSAYFSVDSCLVTSECNAKYSECNAMQCIHKWWRRIVLTIPINESILPDNNPITTKSLHPIVINRIEAMENIFIEFFIFTF